MLHHIACLFECNFSCWNLPIISERMQLFSIRRNSCSRNGFHSPPMLLCCSLSPFSCTNFSISICFSMLFSLCEKKKMNTDLVNQVCFTFCHIFNVYCGGCCWGSLLLLYTLNPFILN